VTKVVVEADESFESALKRVRHKRKALAALKKAKRRERTSD
jgi:ribosomal protein S21